MALKRVQVILLSVGMVLLVLDSATGAWAGSALRRAISAEPETLDPLKLIGLPELAVGIDLFEGLVAFSGDGKVVPGIAIEWVVSPDGRRWTFHLRRDAKWSDGDPVTADDFLYTFRKLFEPATASPNAYLLTTILNGPEILAGEEKDLTRLGVEAPDPYTLIINLRGPAPYLPNLLANIVLPVNRKAFERHGLQWTRPGNIVSNGPFQLEEWTPQAEIVLRRNPHYYAADHVKLDEVRWVVTEDAASAFKSYRAGELDISRVPSIDLDQVQRNYSDELHQHAQLATEYLVFNLRSSPFAGNLKLRQALALAIDRDTPNKKVDPHGKNSTYSFVPLIGDGYMPQSEDYAMKPAPERQALARRLMTEAGYPPGYPLKLTVIYSTDRFVKKRLLSIAANWKDILGVELTLKNREWQIWLSELRHGDFQLSWDSLTANNPDPTNFLAGYRSTAGEGVNDAGYHNSVYDTLIDNAEAASDMQRRTALLEQAERLLLNDVVLIPLDNPVKHTLVNSRVTGWHDNLIGMNPSRYLGLVQAE